MRGCPKLTTGQPGLLLSVMLSVLVWWAPAAAADTPPSAPVPAGREPVAHCDHHNEQRQVFFGDLHVHTSLSLDARLWDTRNTPVDAYRFARGEAVGVAPYNEEGEPDRIMQLARPLDFAMVSDHAEGFGLVEVCHNPIIDGHTSMFCRMFRHSPSLMYWIYLMLPLVSKELGQRGGYWEWLPSLARADKEPLVCGQDKEHCRAATRDPWQRTQRAAELAYDRSSACTFTSFVGYEWTGYTQANIHRNVLFRNEHVPRHPVSFNEATSAPELWRTLDRDCVGSCDAMTIPHNSNVSTGLMFPVWEGSDSRYTLKTARASRRYERLVEVFQHKGDSECWYGAGAYDELCAFEKLPNHTLGTTVFQGLARQPRRSDGFLRYVLNEGLRYHSYLGVNPWQMGFIAGTDTHMGTPGAVAEQKHIAHTAAISSIAFLGSIVAFLDGPQFNPGGLVAIWAEENTRDSLFEALERREVYGTSGPRISLRFFAGDYEDGLCAREDKTELAYARGAPMGSTVDREQLKGGDSMRFLVYAGKDSGTAEDPGGDLQRIQIIKGWLDKTGELQEEVYEVATAGTRAWVDPRSCERHGGGAAQLCAVWEDHEFDPRERAWYYARAVETPSCRWTQQVCNANSVDCSNPDAVPRTLAACCTYPDTIQERAWSSPIWYYPTE